MLKVRSDNDRSPKKSMEKLEAFKATPEVISQYLELKTEEVETQMKSLEGRKLVFKKLMEHEADLRKIHAFNPKELERQIEVAGDALVAKEKLAKIAQSPEKKGMFRRAWEAIKSFPRKHPIVTTILVLAAAAGGMYLLWNYLGNILPVPNPMRGAADVAREVAAPTGGAAGPIPLDKLAPPNAGPTMFPSSPLPGPSIPPGILANPGPLPPVPPSPTDAFPTGGWK